MKKWKDFSEFLLKGEWHVHTSYTDGMNTVFELCERAESLGFPLIAFTEHVRKRISYDFNCFLEDIDRAREIFNIIILSGCEVKVLPDMTLDAEDGLLDSVDYSVFSYHSFPNNYGLYIDSLINILKDSRLSAWGHPGLFLKRNCRDIEEVDLEEILNLMRKNDVLLEINAKYGLPYPSWIEHAEKCGVKLVRGSDYHSIHEMKLY